MDPAVARAAVVQHDLGDRIRSTLHVHLDHEHCLEIVVMHGRSDELHAVAERILAIKGVLHGAIEIYAHRGLPGSHHDHKKHPAVSRPRKRAKPT